ncbi:hypothetical protein GCM10010974_27590 [Brevibacterium sediminis]|uniref:Uncharacterized protein n=1 Tax=Brevibacterium sediminis TaxID=1857024 RepID=A0ABQ1MN23_9MICO|nr:hypothetical protein GCM10010974_27590 [Brevibacterium sediminis]
MFLATVGIDFLPLNHGTGVHSQPRQGRPHAWGLDRAFSLVPKSTRAAVRFLTLGCRNNLAEAALTDGFACTESSDEVLAVRFAEAPK